MSSGPHEVDVPIRDLDEHDDFFRDSEDGRITFDGIEDPFAMNSAIDGSGLDKSRRAVGGLLKATWNKFKTKTNDAYLEVSSFDPSLNDDDEDSTPNSVVELRNYKIHRLNQRLHRTLALVILVFVVFIMLLLLPHWRLNRDADSASSHEVTKRILSNSTHNFHPTTIIISLDGFHPHYINSSNCPFMHEMLLDGYAAPYMTPLFPSSTFPNHWTLVTGLYPSEHGIVGNTFYDPELRMRFINVDPKLGLNPKFWQGGEPIWLTATKQGVRTAVHMWPGSEVPLDPENAPLFVDKFNKSESLSNKINRVMEWIDTGDINKRPELILTYVPIVDTIGHKFGISGPELVEAIQGVDTFLKQMDQQLSARNLDHIVNLIVVSDHGMAPTSKDRLLFLDDVFDLDRVAHVDGWPLMGVRPKAGINVDEIYSEASKRLGAMPINVQDGYSLYKLEDLPEEWHFGGNHSHRFNYRLAPIWLIPHVGYSITTRESFDKNNKELKPVGVHGYNNTELLMRAVFMGQGPYFKEKLGHRKKVMPFDNINVYNIICDGLDLTPSPNNGSLASSDDFAFSTHKVLPDFWSDASVYPGLPFTVDHVVQNATYDNLWRNTHKVEGEEKEGQEDAVEQEEHAEEEPESQAVQEDEDDSKGGDDKSNGETGVFHLLSDLINDGIEMLDNGMEDIGEGFQAGLDLLEDGIEDGVKYLDNNFGSLLGHNPDE